MMASKQSKFAHLGFVLSMLAKGGLGLSQILGGLLLWSIPAAQISHWVVGLARLELVDDPQDPLALIMLRFIQSTPITNESFYLVYLVIHGSLNLGLVLALVVGFKWAYPLSIIALISFVIYQLYKYLHGEGVMMLVLSVIDIVVIWLIWREWKTRGAVT
jgi:uncharacterized membrane protein